MPIHEFIDTIHEISRQRLDNEEYYREPFSPKEEKELGIYASGIEYLLQREVKRPLKISLGLILFLPEAGDRIPLFWAGDDVRGDSHSSLIPEILLKLPRQYMRASVWATRQMRLFEGGSVVEVLPSASREYEEDYGGPTISREFGLRSLCLLSTEFNGTPFKYRTWACEEGVEHTNSHVDRFQN